jgi:hypothetical protein
VTDEGDRPTFFRRLFDPDDGRVRCWACKDYIGCGDRYAVVVRAGHARKLPLLVFCSSCAKSIGKCGMTTEERSGRSEGRSG